MKHAFDQTDRRLRLGHFGARTLIAAAAAAALLLPVASNAANRDAARWRAQGGQLLFSSTHEFTRSYWTHQSVQGDLYWTDGEDQRVQRASHAWDTEVRDRVRIAQGRFAVRGPGQIVAYVRQIQDTPKLAVATSGAGDAFEPAETPGEQLSGWVLAGRDYSFDVALEQAMRFNPATGYRLYQAPQEIEFELWYFAGRGGRVIGLEAAPPSNVGSSGGLFGGSSGKTIGAVEWVQCVRSTATSGAGTVVECGGNGLWRLDANGSRVARLGPGDTLSSGQALETDAQGWARLSLDDDGTKAGFTLRPDTRVGLRSRTDDASGSVVLFEGRLLAAQDLRAKVSLFESRTSVFEVETPNTTIGAPRGDDEEQPETTSYEIGFDSSTGDTEVIAGLGSVELGCKARPQPRRRVHEGDRARMGVECGVHFDFPTPEEVDQTRRLAQYSPGQPAAGGGQPGAGAAQAAGTYIGCYKDGGDSQGRDLDGELLFPSGLTPESCVGECAARGYSFAGLQWGRSCYCGNSYGRYGESDACDSRCAGDSGQICGGYGANSVYSTAGATAGATGSGATAVKPPLGPAPRGVTLYQNGDFEGRSETFLVDVPVLGRTQTGNDRASSVRVGAGCRATLYEHSDYQGVAIEVTGDVPALAATRLGNDEAGSLKVMCD